MSALRPAVGLALGSPATASPAATAKEPYADYLFTYFTGERTFTGERMHMALSRGNDSPRWQELNGDNPVLAAPLGETRRRPAPRAPPTAARSGSRGTAQGVFAVGHTPCCMGFRQQ